MKKYGKLYLLLVLTVTLSMAAFAPQTASGEAETNRPEKIDAALWDVMCASGEDEWIPLYIKLHGINETELLDKVEQKTGMDPAVFLDEARFEKEVASKIREAVEKAFRAEAAQPAGDAAELSDASLASLKTALSAELKTLIGDPETLVEEIKGRQPASAADFIIIETRNRFQYEKGKIQREGNSSVNQAFAEEHVKARGNTVNCAGSYFSALFVDAKKADILYYAQQEQVANIFYADPSFQIAPTLSHIAGQVDADSTTGTKSINFNNGEGFQGNGIRIGILEAEGVIDITSPHFDANRITVVRNGNVSLKTDTHASLVTAIAAGERVGYNSRVYTGIVPEAEIFITCAPDAEAFFSGLQVLRDNGVNVINISLGFLNTTSYTYIDQMLDEFIIDSGITCVVAAGNNANGYGDGSAYINAPGMR